MPQSEVDKWKDAIRMEDYICGPNPDLCPGYDPNWQSQSLNIGPDLSVDGTGIHFSTTQYDTIRGSHTERLTITETMSAPFSFSSSVDTVRTVDADSVYIRESVSLPMPWGSYSKTVEKAVPVPEIDDDDD